MIKSIAKKIVSIESDLDKLESSLVYSFFKINGLDTNIKNEFLKEVLLQSKTGLSEKILKLFKAYNLNFEFDLLVEIFELLIPSTEKKINGAHYTPDFIITAILNETLDEKRLKQNKDYFICDVSCGSGAFFIPIAKKIKQVTNKSYNAIFKDNLFGVDISERSINKAKILLTLLALIDGEDQLFFEFNFRKGNSLTINWYEEFPEVFSKSNGFDLIIGNPPYVRSKNIDVSVKETMAKWISASKGNADLYIPFIELGAELLNDNGELGYITINSFLHSANGEKIREYLLDNHLVKRVVNFGDLQIFENATSYTCLLFLSKEKNQTIKYSVCKEPQLLSCLEYTSLSYTHFDSTPWKLLEGNHFENINKLESCGKPLGEKYSIRNGIATLRNNIYIHKPVSEESEHYIIEFNDKEYKIEKNATKRIVKPNIIKNEDEMAEKEEIVIFPYRKNNKNKYQSITEEEFMKNSPSAFSFLLEYKDSLAERDNGTREYSQWFAFGREQGINIEGKKLFFPYMANGPVFFISKEPDVLFYCGYCILCEDEFELEVLKKILTSDLFWYYIKNVSKDYSNGYKSFAKNYVKNFSIPNLSDDIKQQLYNTEDKQKINTLLCKIYGVNEAVISQQSVVVV